MSLNEKNYFLNTLSIIILCSCGTKITKMVSKTRPNFHSWYTKMLINSFLGFNSKDNKILSSQLLSVTENVDLKIWHSSIISEFMLFIMNLLNSRYAYSTTQCLDFHIHLCDNVLSTIDHIFIATFIQKLNFDFKCFHRLT